MKVDKFKHKDDWENWVGCDVIKHSKKPFKGGKQIERVVNITTNPHSFKQAFILEDESIVDCHQVHLTMEKNINILNSLLLYNDHITTFIDTDNVGIGMTHDDVIMWYHKQSGDDVEVLSIPDIRNKLTPITNLIALLESNIKDPKIDEFIKKEIINSKRCIEYLSGNIKNLENE